MYEVERTADRVIVRRGQQVVYSAPSKSLLIFRYKPSEEAKVFRVGDMTDEQLLLALVSVVQIENLEK